MREALTQKRVLSSLTQSPSLLGAARGRMTAKRFAKLFLDKGRRLVEYGECNANYMRMARLFLDNDERPSLTLTAPPTPVPLLGRCFIGEADTEEICFWAGGGESETHASGGFDYARRDFQQPQPQRGKLRFGQLARRPE